MIILTVDLERTAVHEEPIPERDVLLFFGGRGLTTKLLYDKGAQEDPLSTPVYFGTGPLTGTPFPMGGRYEATARSPLTGTIVTSSCGGRLGISLKKAGVDVLAVRGVADGPVYLSIEKGRATIHGAADLWGREKAYVRGILRQRHGADASVVVIGKAGENGVLFANAENDGRFLGRGGLGAVLGMKRVKAIVARGKGKIDIASKENFDFLAYESSKWLAANPVTSQGLPQFGTGILLNFMRELGLLSAKNFREPAPAGSRALSGEEVTARLLKRRRAGPYCPVACGRVTAYGDGPEYETLWALGVNLGIHDLDGVAELAALCNELGLDTISMGGSLGLACELAETGRFPEDARWGDLEAMKRLIIECAEQRGTGGTLAIGSKRLAERAGMPHFAAQVKGLELPAYDPRGAYGHALGYATSNRGGCHLQGYLIGAETLGIPKLLDRFATSGKASLLALNQNLFAFTDSLVMCRFSSFAIPGDYFARIASAVTGRRITWEESLLIGERIWNLERLFNLREGVEDDTLPERFKTFPLEEMLREYYEIRGWDERGVPTEARLKRLELL